MPRLGFDVFLNGAFVTEANGFSDVMDVVNMLLLKANFVDQNEHLLDRSTFQVNFVIKEEYPNFDDITLTEPVSFIECHIILEHREHESDGKGEGRFFEETDLGDVNIHEALGIPPISGVENFGTTESEENNGDADS